MKDYPVWARNIRWGRRMMDLTWDEFGEVVGMTGKRVGDIERGALPTEEELARICSVLEVTIEELNQEYKIPPDLADTLLQIWVK